MILHYIFHLFTVIVVATMTSKGSV